MTRQVSYNNPRAVERRQQQAADDLKQALNEMFETLSAPRVLH